MEPGEGAAMSNCVYKTPTDIIGCYLTFWLLADSEFEIYNDKRKEMSSIGPPIFDFKCSYRFL